MPDRRQHRSEAAAALHPDAVTQRLQRIETLTSLNLADPAAVVELTAALTMLDVAQGDRS